MAYTKAEKVLYKIILQEELDNGEPVKEAIITARDILYYTRKNKFMVAACNYAPLEGDEV